MSKLILLPLLLLSIVGANRFVSSLPTKTFPELGPNAEISNTCGGVLTASSGQISYKPGVSEYIENNERCVWIIRPAIADKITEFTLGINSIGFDNDNANYRLTIHGHGIGMEVPAEWIPMGVDMSEMKGVPMLIVTFHSGPSASFKNGFVFNYFGHAGNQLITIPSLDSSDLQVANSTFGILKYPELDGSSYTDNELTTILFTQSVSTRNEPLEKMNLIFLIRKMDIGCNDHLRLYKYIAATGWELDSSSLCSSSDSTVMEHNDLMLFVFETDAKVSGTGFQIVHSSCKAPFI